MKVGVFFFYPLGFANCQLVLYISNIREHHIPTAAIITQMSMVLGLLTVNYFRIFKVQQTKGIRLLEKSIYSIWILVRMIV